MDYAGLVAVYEQLESTSKRLEKTFFIAELLKRTPADDLSRVLLLLQGKVFSAGDERKAGVAAKTVAKTIIRASGSSQQKVEDAWKKTGDLGIAAEQLIGRRLQTTLGSSGRLSVAKVLNTLQKLATMEGHGAVAKKVDLISEVLASASAGEAKYLVRLLLEELRVGAADCTIRDAIVWAFFSKEAHLIYDSGKQAAVVADEHRKEYSQIVDEVQHAYDLANDFGVVAQAAKKGREALSSISLAVGIPLKVMLFQKAKGIADAFSRVGKPAAFEFKYDGFRLNIHKKGKEVTLFTRRLENVTVQFPDIIAAIAEHVHAKDAILDAEVIGIDQATGKWKPFQDISQRIKRKYDIAELVQSVPVMVNVFDILALNGKSMIDSPFSERRKAIEQVVSPASGRLQLAEQIITDSEEAVENFYKKALSLGNEGIMGKNLAAPYKPGSRVGFGVKIKPTLDPLDLVITAATWGEGRRVSWLSSFLLSCRDGNSYREVGRVGTGIKELEGSGVTFQELTTLLKPLIVRESGNAVFLKPRVVVEVAFEEVQKSTAYNSGFALRFPRLLRLREDKPAREAATLAEVKGMYEGQ